MNIEYKIDWRGPADVPCSVIVTTELELAKYLSELNQGKTDGYVKEILVRQRGVEDWSEVTIHKDIFKPGDTVIYQGVKHTLLVLVFPGGIATWIAISAEVGAEATMIEETDLLESSAIIN